MKTKLLAAALLTSVAFVASPVNATQLEIGGGLNVNIGGEGSGMNAGVEVEAGVEAEGNASADAMAESDGQVMLGGDVSIDTEAIYEQAVYTSDGARVGVVSNVVYEDDTAYLIVTMDDGWNDEVPTIAVEASSVLMVENQLQVESDEASLRSSIEAALAASASANAG